MKFFRLSFVLSLLVLLLGRNSVCGEQIVITAGRDNTIFSESTNSAGAASTMIAGRTNGGAIRRTLLHFDVAGSIPAAATVTNASLTLHLDGISLSESEPRDMGLHRFAADWGEGTSGVGGAGGGQGSTPTVGDATWIHRSFDTALWQVAGGDFATSPSAVSSVGTEIDFYNWATTAELVTDVQGWLGDPASNFGWALLGDESNNASARRFNSRESAGELRPALTVEFTPIPEPSATLLIVTALLVLASYRRALG